MGDKPTIQLTLVADKSLEDAAALYSREALESELHQYSLSFTLSEARASRALVFLCPAQELLSPLRQGSLRFVGCFGLPLFVAWLNCGKLKEKNQLVNEEIALRQTLFMLGLDGDSATIIRFYGGFSEANLPRLLAALDANALLLLQPQKRPTPSPEGPADSFARLLLDLDGLRSLGAELSISRPNPSKQKLATKIGGMPYLETGEAWPGCRMCNGALKFLWQVDASDLLSTDPLLGLYVFYLCDNPSHQESFSIRRYEKPSLEKMSKPMKEAETPLLRTGAPISSGAVSYTKHHYIPQRLDSHQSTQSLISTFADSDSSEARALRQELLSTITPMDQGIFLRRVLELLPARETIVGRDYCFHVGGYFVPKEMDPFGDECACKHCKKRMQTLTHIRYGRARRISLFDAHLFLVCPCTPDDVVVHPGKAR
jgi:hypothetical protein